MTQQEYHDDENNYGNYQFVPLKKVISSFLLASSDDDNVLKNIPRYRVLQVAKEGIQELNKNILNEIYAAEITVPDNLSFALPHDFVELVRISLVVFDKETGGYKLETISENRNIHTAKAYLQTNSGEIYFNVDGEILTIDNLNAYEKPVKNYQINPKGNEALGSFKIDRNRGKIVFSSELAEKDLVLEYLSDGLIADSYEEGQIKIHKNYTQLLLSYMYYKLIEFRLSVSQAEKRRALMRYKTEKHQAKIEALKFNIFELTRK